MADALEKLYKAPSFQFYPDDFIGGTNHLSPEDVGVYVRLICSAWGKGGISADVRAQARIAGTTPARMKRIWSNIADKFSPHPSDPKLLIQRRLETIREDAAVHRTRRQQAGRIGGNVRAGREQLTMLGELLDHVVEASNAIALPQHSHSGASSNAVAIASSPSPISGSPDQSPTAPDQAPPPKWVTALREQITALSARLLSSLDVDERHVLARYHCLVFGNCTKSEANNKAKASQVAAGLASMARNESFGKLTVLAYVKYARKVHAQREEKPFFDPWMLRAVVEWQAP